MTRPVLPSGPIPAKIMIVGEAPGAEEERLGAPFVGASGNELTRTLTEAGIARNQCFITNVIRIRPPNNDLGAFIAFKKKDITPSHVPLRDKMVLHCVKEGYDLLCREIELCDPNIIIALGNCALWALTGNWGIVEWRGSVLESDILQGRKVLAAYHPAAILRQWSWRPTLVHDLRRAKVESTDRSLKAPPWAFKIRPSYDTCIEVLDLLQAKVELCGAVKVGQSPGYGLPIPCETVGPLTLAVDIETRMHHITCIGLAWSKTEALCIPLTTEGGDGNYWMEHEEAEIVYRLARLLTHPGCKVVGQNFIYDAQHIQRWWKFIPNLTDDTMLAQHTMFPGTPKSLDYLASLYCEHYAQWKSASRALWKDAEFKKDE